MDNDNNNNYQNNSYEQQDVEKNNLEMNFNELSDNLRNNNPGGDNSHPEIEEKANKLSRIALMMFVVPIFITVIMKLVDNKEFQESKSGSVLTNMLFFLQIASLVFSIYINEKYPKTALGRFVLVLISGSYYLLFILGVILVPLSYFTLCMGN